MSNPSAPPPYEDHNPLYPGSPPPGGYGQPSVLPGGYPAYPAYPQPGYGHPAGYPQPVPPVHPMPMNYGHDYNEEERAGSDSFRPGEWDDRKVRHSFIQKVYCIISVQLLITVAIIAIFTWSMQLWGPSVSPCSWLMTHSWSWGTGSTPSARRTTSQAPYRSTQI
ncbi:transmembrane BAX inhibitor motif containing 1, isoform CRA_a [Mus musculus]|nr:transmembrane BAX inhibitor motif containing 1, isoform CRA_a [Mus musculus]